MEGDSGGIARERGVKLERMGGSGERIVNYTVLVYMYSQSIVVALYLSFVTYSVGGYTFRVVVFFTEFLTLFLPFREDDLH